jgi:glutamine synthetase
VNSWLTIGQKEPKIANNTDRYLCVKPNSKLDAQRDYVLRTAEERGVKYIQLWFSDVLGIPKSFQITPAELENALFDGMTFDGSAIDGFSRVQESDVLAMPDPQTFAILATDHSVARIFCDLDNLDGTPFEGCPRNVLRRSLEKAHQKGFSFFAAPELEYFYFQDCDPSHSPKPLDFGSYFELTVADFTSKLRKETVLALEESGIPVEYSQHEDAPSQHEIDLRHTDALTMADNILATRLIIKEIASQRGVHASFMPKPLAGVQGSGMHTHFSLFNNETNAFSDPYDPYSLSETAKGFIAGILKHAPEFTAITNQWVNSYKRLVTGYEAPTYISWARSNRSALVRVPIAKGANPDSTRIEYRAPDAACNPYLTFSVILAAGLKGVEEKYQLPAEASENLYHMSLEELHQNNVTFLPGNLDEAITIMEGSDLMRETLGSHVFEWFIRNKRDEWAAYKTHVSQFELDRYLRTL